MQSPNPYQPPPVAESSTDDQSIATRERSKAALGRQHRLRRIGNVWGVSFMLSFVTTTADALLEIPSLQAFSWLARVAVVSLSVNLIASIWMAVLSSICIARDETGHRYLVASLALPVVSLLYVLFA